MSQEIDSLKHKLIPFLSKNTTGNLKEIQLNYKEYSVRCGDFKLQFWKTIFIQVCPAHFYASTKEYLRISALPCFNLIRQEKNETEEGNERSVGASSVEWNAMAVQLFGEMLLKCH